MQEDRPIAATGIASILRKRRLPVLIVIVAVLVTALLYEAKKPVYYISFVDIAVNPLAVSLELMNAAPEVLNQEADAEIPYFVDHVHTVECIDAVIQTGLLGPAPSRNSVEWQSLFDALTSNVEARRLENRNIVRITVKNSDSELAVGLTDAFGSAYVSSISRIISSAPKRLAEFLDQEIARTELEVARYRGVVAELNRQKEVSGTVDAFHTANARLDEVRRVLQSRVDALKALDAKAAEGTPPELFEYRNAFSAIFAAVPLEMRELLGGETRIRMDDAYATWLQRDEGIKKLARTYTPLHPEYIQARVGAQEATDELVDRIVAWVREADIQLAEQIRHSYGMAAAEDPSVASLLDGKPIEYDEQALESNRIELRIREALLEKLLSQKSDVGIQNSQAGEIAELIRPALSPADKHEPDYRRAGAFGFAIALFAGIATALVLESLDRLHS